MTTAAGRFSLRVEQLDGFEFKVKFDKDHFAPLLLDEPPPLGHDRAPNAARVLAAAIGNCLAASLLFCAQRTAHVVGSVWAEVHVELVRNEHRRLRIGKVNVVLHTNLAPEAAAVQSCLATFEDFCVVTQSVRRGIEVEVEVRHDVA